MVEFEEAVEAMEELELCRVAVFRGPGANILLTSSVLFHPNRVLGVKEPTTAVICVVKGSCSLGAPAGILAWPARVSSLCRSCLERWVVMERIGITKCFHVCW